MSGTACSDSLAGIGGILQEELLVTISRLHKHLSGQFWAFTVIYYCGEAKKTNFSNLNPKLHLSVLITMNLHILSRSSQEPVTAVTPRSCFPPPVMELGS